jgi:DNA-binding NarL/FixJ family response regulator
VRSDRSAARRRDADHFLSPRTVETHVRHILIKLVIAEAADYHRRVLIVFAYLRG